MFSIAYVKIKEPYFPRLTIQPKISSNQIYKKLTKFNVSIQIPFESYKISCECFTFNSILISPLHDHSEPSFPRSRENLTQLSPIFFLTRESNNHTTGILGFRRVLSGDALADRVHSGAVSLGLSWTSFAGKNPIR